MKTMILDFLGGFFTTMALGIALYALAGVIQSKAHTPCAAKHTGSYSCKTM